MQATKTADAESDGASDVAKVPPEPRAHMMATVTSLSRRSTAQAFEAAANCSSIRAPVSVRICAVMPLRMPSRASASISTLSPEAGAGILFDAPESPMVCKLGKQSSLPVSLKPGRNRIWNILLDRT